MLISNCKEFVHVYESSGMVISYEITYCEGVFKVMEESVMFLLSLIAFVRKVKAITIKNDVWYIQMFRQFGFTCHCILISK